MAERCAARQREAQRIRAVIVDDTERIDDVALGLRHLRALLVTDETVDVDVLERHLLHEVQPDHHHAGDPEEDDVEAGDQRRGRIEALQFVRLVRPAERRERPEPRREPGVEHVLVARDERRALCRIDRHLARLVRRQRAGLLVIGERAGHRFVLGLGDEHLAVRPVPRRNLMAPPELARDAPRLDVLHPVEIGLLPVLRHEVRLAFAHRGDGLDRQRLGVHVPLVGEERLDHHIGAVAVRHHVRVRLDLVEEARHLQPLDDRLARLEAIEAVQLHRLVERGRRRHTGEKRLVVRPTRACLRRRARSPAAGCAACRPRSR